MAQNYNTVSFSVATWADEELLVG